ncbi:hypothetical protein NYE40_17405 [Paenibacillus sp. FSL W8-1187]|uniref:Uncharacterized protein n=1 Tax=Paenibacillus pasadenensis TaxID=217090 RepID=A0A2N5N9J4_9BACL|nr:MULTISPECIES: hypothetical protein [Paenibacillus]PLT47027.1 hypothetical protein B8V81_1251 [Paenibacillus pasadenensis]QGG57370.1 hypothetical protein GE073_18405 [Paenibacillus sp. B01]
MRKWKHGIYLLAALGMLVYALPRLELSGAWTAATVFGIMWSALAMLVIAANLRALASDRERERRRIAAIRRQQAYSREQAAARRRSARRGG